MIDFVNTNDDAPLILLIEKYNQAINAHQKNIEAIAISSFNKELNEVDSRFVNIKSIINDEFIFFTNYNSPKSVAFESHNQISGLFFWPSINTQIRLKAEIKKTSKKFNEEYFKKRLPEKNALAISSKQSEYIKSYEDVHQKYNEVYTTNNLFECPDYWGGFSFIPHYFEFWEGHKSRINKRLVYKKSDARWEKFIIQP